jgi:hypothetical protein
VVTQGRLANPDRANEFVLDTATARALGYHLGETVTIGWIANDQPHAANLRIPRDHEIRAKLVGVGAVDVNALFQDQDNAMSSSIELFTPALTRKLRVCCSNDMESALTLDGGNRFYGKVEAELRAILPKGLPFTYIQAPDVLARAERTLRSSCAGFALTRTSSVCCARSVPARA